MTIELSCVISFRVKRSSKNKTTPKRVAQAINADRDTAHVTNALNFAIYNLRLSLNLQPGCREPPFGKKSMCPTF